MKWGVTASFISPAAPAFPMTQKASFCPLGLDVPGRHWSCSYVVVHQVDDAVCGTDGLTYHNECQLQMTSCRSQTLVLVESLGPCGQYSSIFFVINISNSVISLSTYCRVFLGYVTDEWHVTHIIQVTHAQKTCTRNLHGIESSSIWWKFLAVAWQQKHSRPIKPHNFGHMHQCKFLQYLAMSMSMSIVRCLAWLK